MKILKFGAKLLNSVSDITSIVQLINTSEKKIVVLSARETTTEQLSEIMELVQQRKEEEAKEKIVELEKEYRYFFLSLNNNATYKSKVEDLLNFRLGTVRKFNQDLFNIHKSKELLSIGELLFSELFCLYLGSLNIENTFVSALDFMKIDQEGEPIFEDIKKDLETELSKKSSSTIITQSFICRNPFGQVDRHVGGGDFTASVIGGVIKASEIQLFTSNKSFKNVGGEYNSSKSKKIDELSFDEAAEVAYFGDKVIHPSSIAPAKKFGVSVRIINSLATTEKGTLITATEGKELKALVAKDGIVAIKINSNKMLFAYGFLRNIFEIFEYYKTSVDMITTSEVSVSLTIEDTSFLDAIVKSLGKFGLVEVDKNQSIVSIIGDFIRNESGFAAKVSDAVKTIPLRMISYGGSKNNLSIVIDTKYKTEAIQSLSNKLLS